MSCKILKRSAEVSAVSQLGSSVPGVFAEASGGDKVVSRSARVG